MDLDKAMEQEFGGKKLEAACPFCNGNMVFDYMQLSQGQIVRCQHCDKDVRLTADKSGLQKAEKEINKSVDDLRKRIRDINRGLKF